MGKTFNSFKLWPNLLKRKHKHSIKKQKDQEDCKKAKEENASLPKEDSYLSDSDFEAVKSEYESSSKKRTLYSDEFLYATIDQIKIRDVLYRRLLDDYVKYAHLRNSAKTRQRNDFYVFVKNILKVSGFFFSVFTIRVILSSAKEMEALLPLIITGFITFFAEFVSLLAIIARHLFDNKEDDNITKIINHTQDFDASGREYVNRRLSENQETDNKKSTC